MNDMDESKKELMREWVRLWKETGKALEIIRRKEMRNSKLEETIEALDKAFKSALLLAPNSTTSGLVEFHRILAKSQ